MTSENKFRIFCIIWLIVNAMSFCNIAQAAVLNLYKLRPAVQLAIAVGITDIILAISILIKYGREIYNDYLCIEDDDDEDN